MTNYSPDKFDLYQELAKCRTREDLCGKGSLLQRLVGPMIEVMLQKEMDEHIGYQKHAIEGHNSGNSRNGKGAKTVQSSYGPTEIEVPRDRNREFDPKIVKKRQRNISQL